MSCVTIISLIDPLADSSPLSKVLVHPQRYLSIRSNRSRDSDISVHPTLPSDAPRFIPRRCLDRHSLLILAGLVEVKELLGVGGRSELSNFPNGSGHRSAGILRKLQKPKAGDQAISCYHSTADGFLRNPRIASHL